MNICARILDWRFVSYRLEHRPEMRREISHRQFLCMTVHVTRLPVQLLPDPRRVITRFFAPGEVNRIKDTIERLLAFPEANVV